MELKFLSKLYPKSVLLKSAYNFTDRAYVHLDERDGYYIVTLEPKLDCRIESGEFKNEMLAQSVKHEIYMQTKDIRRLTLARAFASTVVEAETCENEEPSEDFDMDDVLRDWFENE